jgi:hypothetical protein
MPEKEDLRNDDSVSEQKNATKMRQPPPRRPEYATRYQGRPQNTSFVSDGDDDDDNDD